MSGGTEMTREAERKPVVRAWRQIPAELSVALAAAIWAAALPTAVAQDREARVVFVGDTGTGDRRAQDVRDSILSTARSAGLSHVFLLGDNIYENGAAEDIERRFINIYRPVMDLGVAVRAALGNHDVKKCDGSDIRPVPRDASAYEPARDCWAADHLATPEFGYEDGSRYYSVTIPDDRAPLVEVFVIDSNTLGEDQTKIEDGADQAQLDWLDAALAASTARWKIVAMHHPIYSPARNLFLGFGRRSADGRLRAQLEPLFREHGVDVVFQGHQHMYARVRPQAGIRYFVTGGGGKKPYSFKNNDNSYPREDNGKFNHFVYSRVSEERFEYCVIDEEEAVRDGGWFAKGDATDTEFPAAGCPIIRSIAGAGTEVAR